MAHVLSQPVMPMFALHPSDDFPATQVMPPSLRALVCSGISVADSNVQKQVSLLPLRRSTRDRASSPCNLVSKQWPPRQNGATRIDRGNRAWFHMAGRACAVIFRRLRHHPRWLHDHDEEASHLCMCLGTKPHAALSTPALSVREDDGSLSKWIAYWAGDRFRADAGPKVTAR